MRRSLPPCWTVWIVFACYVFPWMSSVNNIYSSGEFLCSGTISFYLPLYLLRYSPSSFPERRKKGREWELALGRMSTGFWVHPEKADIVLGFPGLQEPTGSKITPNLDSVLFLYTLESWQSPILPNENKGHLGGVGKKHFRQLKLLF